MFQLTAGKVDFLITMKQIWSWQSNVDAGIAVLGKKISEAVAWGDKHRNNSHVKSKIREQAQAIGMPSKENAKTNPLDADQVVEEAVQRYNGGNAWRLVGDRLDGLSGGDSENVNVRKVGNHWRARWYRTDNGYLKLVLGNDFSA